MFVVIRYHQDHNIVGSIQNSLDHNYSKVFKIIKKYT